MEGTSDRSFTLNIPKARPNQQQLAGGSPPKPSYGRTPLHVAVMSGDIVSARLLLDNGAAPDYTDAETRAGVIAIQTLFRHHRWRHTRPPWTPVTKESPTRRVPD